jgi:hypothetical protein
MLGANVLIVEEQIFLLSLGETARNTSVSRFLKVILSFNSFTKKCTFSVYDIIYDASPGL